MEAVQQCGNADFQAKAGKHSLEPCVRLAKLRYVGIGEFHQTISSTIFAVEPLRTTGTSNSDFPLLCRTIGLESDAHLNRSLIFPSAINAPSVCGSIFAPVHAPN